MFTIEPCCTQKHWPELLRMLDREDPVFFQGYGDLSLSELLPVILSSYSETDMLLVCPRLPDASARALSAWMRKQWARMDGRGSLDVIRHLTIVGDLRQAKSPMASAWMEENPFEGRLTLRDRQQNDTALVLPDLALLGCVNLSYGGHFTACVTKNARTIRSLRAMYESL